MNRTPKGARAARSGREVAARVLAKVATDAAWASRALDAELSQASLHPAEAARATDLVYGALRSARALDARIEGHCDRGLPSEPVVLACLRGATYELVHTRAESHAVLDAWVGAVKAERGIGLSRFANAVLRRLAAARPPSPLPLSASFPGWIHDEALRSLGPERAERFFTFAAEPAWLALRVRGPREDFAEELRALRPGAQIELGGASPRAVLARGLGDPRRLPGYAAGRFAVQDEGSQWIADALAAEAGQRVLDACAGRGGKTLALADAAGPEGAVVAVDVSAPKLDQLAREARRLGLEGRVERHAIDLSVGLGGLPERSFDRVLVDAPCSGLGTLGRRPEIALRLVPSDPPRLAALQRAILERAARVVRPGGRLVYAVCSFAHAEIEHTLALPGLRRIDAFDLDGRRFVADADGVFRLGAFTEARAMDTYQVVVFEAPLT
jgi:16S rRNA (cytosine967-C5)-methyltransferase